MSEEFTVDAGAAWIAAAAAAASFNFSRVFNTTTTSTTSSSSNGSRDSDLLQLSPSDPAAAASVQGDGPAVVRIVISLVYALVCALGLVGNVLVMYLMKSKQVWKKSSINLFVTSLAVTDFHFVLTLPFWAVENALDFTWLFGKAMCKIVSYVTAVNMYASVFFLTAMSVARYWSLAHALRGGRRRPPCCTARCVAVSIWFAAVTAALPPAFFSTTVTLADEDLCLVKFPDTNGTAQFWLGLYHSQKVLLGFVAPLAIISASYALLLRVVTAGAANASGSSCARRRAKVTKSVTIVVLSFFLCWLPNQALTVWGIFVKLNVVDFSYEYYTMHVYVFPVSVCLAHSNSCLNPVLYCLMRREFRRALKKLFLRMTLRSMMRPIESIGRGGTMTKKRGRVLQLVPASAPEEPAVLFYPPGVVMYSVSDQRDLPHTT